MELEERARELAGNWTKWNSFYWPRSREIADAKNWAIVYTSNRDSTLLYESNAMVYDKAMEPFIEADEPDVCSESHSHWACGYVDGYSIRVYNSQGNITEAFKTYHKLKEREENYPILDENDYSMREYEATYENTMEAVRQFTSHIDAEWPDDIGDIVYEWLNENSPNSLENRDDNGGWPSDDDIQEAIDAYLEECEEQSGS